MVPPIAVRNSRRASNNSQGSGIPGGSSSVGPSVGSIGYDSSSSDWPDDASDKESLQSWAKEQQEKEAEDEADLFATKEEQHLRRWFIVITFALMIVGVCVCVFTYYYLTGQEDENFELGVSKVHPVLKRRNSRANIVRFSCSFTIQLKP